MTRRLPVLLAILGAVLIIVAVIVATVVRSTDTATLALPERPDTAIVVTEPGVLSSVDPTVTVRAVADDDEPVVLAIGRTTEVEAWLDDAEHVRVVGLSSWEELSVEVSTGSGTPTPEPEPTAATTPTAEPTAGATDAPAEEPTALPNPAGSDLWVAEATGTGEVELSWADQPGRWSLVAATDGAGPAPMLELEWGRQVATPWLVPAIVVGALLLIAGLTMLVLDRLARREQERRDEARARQALDWTPAGAGPLATTPVGVDDTDPDTGERLSRRQIREMERAVAQAERGRRRGDDEAPPFPLAGDDDHDTAVPDDAAGDDAATTSTAAAAVPDDAAGDDAATGTGEESAPDGGDEPAGEADLTTADREPSSAAAEAGSAEAPAAGGPTDVVADTGSAETPSDTSSETGSGVGAETDRGTTAETGAGSTSAGASAAPAGTGAPADLVQDEPDVADEPEIPADGSTPVRRAPVAAAGPGGLRGWWTRRRGTPSADRETPRTDGEAPPEKNESASGPDRRPVGGGGATTGAGIGSGAGPGSTGDAASSAGIGPDAGAEHPGTADEDASGTAPSWRSVWGFGATPGPRETGSTDDARDDEEGR